MGNSCSGGKDKYGRDSVSRGINKQASLNKNRQNLLRMNSTDQNANPLKPHQKGRKETNACISRADLGLYDTRVWDSEYIRHFIEGEGPKPGPHPDPNCPWNHDENSFNFR